MAKKKDSISGQKHHGGVSFLFSDNALLRDNIVNDNRAADSCGGIIFNVSENATLIGNTVKGNHAGSHGFGINAGGLCFTDSDGAILMASDGRASPSPTWVRMSFVSTSICRLVSVISLIPC